MATMDVAQVIAGIKSLTANPPNDKAARLELYEALKDLSAVIEDPQDTIFRVVYSVSRNPVCQALNINACSL